ncbi:hypothetical protein [Bacillus kwashiorkori]|uniref:hypothetical protein n=1 Tax=Bacillus kwashiorkori TaxID=1522318 RepID=UPI0007826920|nr:hypothetical protein [Bacillus kwashiorkori]
MKEFFILNPFQFLSYEITRQLLETGHSVHYQNTIEPFEIEKELMIGRNSNFQQHTKFAKELLEKENLHIILPVYDLLFRKGQFNCFDYSNTINFCQSKSKQPLTIIAPFSKYAQVIAEQEKLQKLTCRLQMIFVPTLYGKYQPENSLFFEAIKNHSLRDSELFNTPDFHQDTLHITEAVSEIIQIMNNNNTGIFLLKNMDKDRLHHCLFTIIGRTVSLPAMNATFIGELKDVKDTGDYLSIIEELSQDIRSGQIVR